jgi:hypothetical protein
MKPAMVFVTKALIHRLLIVVPVYLAIILMLGMKSVATLVAPFAHILPSGSPPRSAPPPHSSSRSWPSSVPRSAQWAILRAGWKRRCWKDPGYSVLRSLTATGGPQSRSHLEGRARRGSVPSSAFIIESSTTVLHRLCPLDPPPFAGAVVLDRHRVSRRYSPCGEGRFQWGSGAKDIIGRDETGRSK